MAKKVCDIKQMTREEWLEVRRQGIGGSDAGSVMGMSPWRDALTLYADKLGMLEDKQTNEAMRIGTDLEQYVADRFCEATGKKVRRSNYMWQSEEHHFMLADIDREIVGENAALECKTTSAFTKYDLEAGEIPAQYYCQVQHYISVMGYDYMYIAFLVMGVGFYWHKVEKNEDFIKALIEREEDFWTNNVLKEVPPQADGSESSLDTLSRMYPQSNDTLTVNLSCESEITEYLELKDIEKRTKARMDEIKAHIAQELEEASTGETDKYIITYKTQTRESLDSKALKADMPDIYAKYAKSSSSRVLRTKERK